MKKSSDIYYQAMLAQDHRFDGKFFVGVKTTGIYCRPICPSKPKRQNVELFKNNQEAEAAGYRPCMRCRPESAPLSPTWIGKSAIVQRSVRYLNSVSFPNEVNPSDILDFDEDGFARKFGVTARHLRRLFIEEIGKTPKQLASENRLNLARKLVVETSLPISEVAFASGFLSIRRFNDAFKQRFKKSPSKSRKNKAKGKLNHGLEILLPYRPPFDFEGLLKSYETHKVGNLEWFENNKMVRVLEINGKVGTVTISNDANLTSLRVEINFPDITQIHNIVARVRNFFELDSDPILVANALETDPKIKKLLAKSPGVRLPSGWDPFETAISIILGQLVKVERGQKLVHQLIEIAGSESALILNGNVIKLFPKPKDIMSADLSRLKTTAARKKCIVEFCRAFETNLIHLESTQEVDKFEQKLLAIKGIGPWTAQYMSLKVLRSTDAFPTSDLVISKALKHHSIKAINLMSPWRGYVAALMWSSHVETRRGKGEVK